MGVLNPVETRSLGAPLSLEAYSSLEVSSSSLPSASLLLDEGILTRWGAFVIRKDGLGKHLLAVKYFIWLYGGWEEGSKSMGTVGGMVEGVGVEVYTGRSMELGEQYVQEVEEGRH